MFLEPGLYDGKDAQLPKMFPAIPSSAYMGEGDNVVVLIDNIRDENFYDAEATGTTGGYVIGYWKDTTFDRLIVVVDGVAWKHRLGANPQDASVPTDRCRDFPARPHGVEATLAHEYNHLLQDEQDSLGSEDLWVMEGLASWSETLHGYTDASSPRPANDNINCFLGHYQGCGPENSLTYFFDGPSIDEDYGAAASFMHYLDSQFGPSVLGDLIRDERHGLDSLDRIVRARGSGQRVGLRLPPRR